MGSKGSILGAALVGVAAGAIAGVLLAPKAGKETRQDLMDLADRMKGDVADRLSKLSKVTRSAYNETVDMVLKKYQDAKEITKEQSADLKNEFSRRYDNVKQTAEDSMTEDGAKPNAPNAG